MEKFFFIIGDYLKGKSVYPVMQRILNFLFSSSISSFLFEKFYFKYSWIDFTDYKAILDFFIKGYFFIPFSIFIIVHVMIRSIADYFFSLSVFNKSQKWQSKIFAFELTKEEFPLMENKLNNQIGESTVKNNNWIKQIYDHIKESVTEEQWRIFINALDKEKQKANDNFALAFKAIIVITIYFFTINYFGWILYLAVLLILLIILIGLWFLGLTLSIIPAIAQKFKLEIEKYIKSTAESQ